MEGKISAAIYVNAGNDRSGNPRRGWIVYRSDLTGRLCETGFVDEGYAGNGALDSAGIPREIASWRSLAITPGEYRRLMRAQVAA